MNRVLVTGAGGPAGVNLARSMRAADEPMWIVETDTNRFHLEWRSLTPPTRRVLVKTRATFDFLNDVVDKRALNLSTRSPMSRCG